MRIHHVRQGETIYRLSQLYNVPAEKIWNHPDNRGLRDAKRRKSCLYAGDRVTIPDVSLKEVDCQTEKRHRFQRAAETVELKLQFLEQGEPRANEPYSLRIGAVVRSGDLDSEGRLHERVPADATRAEIWVGNDEERVRRQYEIRIGHLDPIEEISGVQQRLNNLGLFCSEEDGELSEDTQAAIEAYQEGKGQDATGQLTDALKQGICRDHGEEV